MIDLLFYYGTEIVLVRIDGHNVQFGSSTNAHAFAPLSGLKLDYAGCIRQFPDLETNPDWRNEVVKRWKEKIKELDNEDRISDYIIKELEKHGYVIKKKMKAGFRARSLN